MTKVCLICGKDFYPCKPTSTTCSAQCRNAHTSRKTREKRSETLRGKGDGVAYPKLFGRHAHRVVMEQKLGRPLQDGEVVHHKDGNILNYDPDNLELLPSQAEHCREHFTKNRKCEVEGCDRKHYGHGFCSMHYQREYKIYR